MTGNHLADQAQAAENKRGCCGDCGNILDEVTVCPGNGEFCYKSDCNVTTCTMVEHKLYCPTCGVFFEIG